MKRLFSTLALMALLINIEALAAKPKDCRNVQLTKKDAFTIVSTYTKKMNRLDHLHLSPDQWKLTKKRCHFHMDGNGPADSRDTFSYFVISAGGEVVDVASYRNTLGCQISEKKVRFSKEKLGRMVIEARERFSDLPDKLEGSTVNVVYKPHCYFQYMEAKSDDVAIRIISYRFDYFGNFVGYSELNRKFGVKDSLKVEFK